MESAVRDDRILPFTKVICAIIVPFLLVAFVLLYLFPDNTKELFAWEIKPRMTPMLMGAGYIAGAYFFVRALAETRWHRIALGFLPVSAFTWPLGIATLLHLDRFTPGHIAYYIWFILYLVTPFLIPIVWLRNRVTDPGTPEPHDGLIPATVRMVLGVVGGLLLITGLLLFVLPTMMITIWPWQLTPLTARVVAGWLALPGVGGLAIAREPRWNAVRIPFEGIMIWLVLLLIAVGASWNNFDWSKPLTWIFVAVLIGELLGMVALYIRIESWGARKRRGDSLIQAAIKAIRAPSPPTPLPAAGEGSTSSPSPAAGRGVPPLRRGEGNPERICDTLYLVLRPGNVTGGVRMLGALFYALH
jgi:hypothetical protein